MSLACQRKSITGLSGLAREELPVGLGGGGGGEQSLMGMGGAEDLGHAERQGGLEE